MTKPIIRKLRCAVYTRKSSEEGLEQEFNSLHAQREACEAYIASQRSEGWVLVRDQYDDGGTLERPGLKRLMEDIEDGLVDVVVVYKIDRLSRSLADFAKLVEVFDRNGVTFVSVTQQFNTTTSMGRLTLNILLSFAQFEREVTAERIRDKVAASRRKGMWMGGVPPYGYRVENRKLVVDEDSAAHVRWIFARFLEIGSCTVLAREVGGRGIRTPRGNQIDKKYLYRLLNNRAYIGEAVHKGDSYPGEHDAIIDRETWDRVHAILQESPRKRAARTRAQTPALLKGLLFGPNGAAFSPTHTRKGGRLYRYYVSQTVLKHGAGSCPIGRVPAGEIEPPRVYRRAKLSENCPSWNRIERRPQSRIHLSSARVRCGLSRSIATNIEATQQRMLRSPANWAVRQTVFASGCVRPNVMVASGRDRPVLRRLVSKSLNARTGNCVRPMRS
jgi:site-specific DNA recombinase